MAIWTVLFIEKWKRKNINLQYEWDVIDFEKKMERMRVEYELLSNLPKIKNPLTDVKATTKLNKINAFVFCLLIKFSCFLQIRAMSRM